MPESCCQSHIVGGCWYDPCCHTCPEALCLARLGTRRCTAQRGHSLSTSADDHSWSA